MLVPDHALDGTTRLQCEVNRRNVRGVRSHGYGGSCLTAGCLLPPLHGIVAGYRVLRHAHCHDDVFAVGQVVNGVSTVLIALGLEGDTSGLIQDDGNTAGQLRTAIGIVDCAGDCTGRSEVEIDAADFFASR